MNAGMSKVVDWARSRGHVVILGVDGTYDVYPFVSLTAIQFLRWVNLHRTIEGMEPFPEELAVPWHLRRKGHPGYVHLLVRAEGMQR